MNNLIIKTKEQALKIVGGLSKPSKMPGMAWSISADKCHIGSKLRNVKNSTCSHCYAKKGRYVFKNTQKAMQRRLDKLKDPLWIEAMVFLLKNEKHFRFFDSGDLQDEDHLKKIITVCERVPNCKFWIPTREIAIVKNFLKSGGKIPDNACIRISAPLIDKTPIVFIDGCQYSTCSSTPKLFDKAHDCPVSYKKEIKKCEEAGCTACWNKNVEHINYVQH